MPSENIEKIFFVFNLHIFLPLSQQIKIHVTSTVREFPLFIDFFFYFKIFFSLTTTQDQQEIKYQMKIKRKTIRRREGNKKNAKRVI